MTEQSMTPAEQTIREALEKTTSLITGAKRLITEGRTVDLSALQERVRIVTDAVQAAPVGVAASYTEHLEVLFEILDALEADLGTQHTRLEDGIKTLKRRKATSAYTQPADKDED